MSFSYLDASTRYTTSSKEKSSSTAKGASKMKSPTVASANSSNAGKGRNTVYDGFFKEQKPKPRRKKRKAKVKLTPIGWLLRAVIIGSSMILAWCLFAYYMVIFNDQQELHRADAGVILGAALWNDQPSPALKERLDYAVELFDEGFIDYLVLSGGKPAYSRGLSEAEGMQQYLMQAGIPEQQLLLEAHSTDTYENLLYSKRVLDKEGLQSVIIITHNYHTQRAEDIAAYVGIEHIQTAGVKTTVLNESYHYTREMLAYSKWQLNKLLMPLGIII